MLIKGLKKECWGFF